MSIDFKAISFLPGYQSPILTPLEPTLKIWFFGQKRSINIHKAS